MATADQIVGPVPEGADPETYDKLRRRVLWTMPYGLYVVGSRDGDRHNGMTLNWATQLSFEPRKLLGVSVEKEALTHELIEAGRVFSLNILSRDDRPIVRKFTKPVEVDLEGRTLNGFPFHHGASGAPILDQAVAYADCRLAGTFDCGDHTLFVGEVIDAAFQAAEDTPVLRMEDTRMSYGG